MPKLTHLSQKLGIDLAYFIPRGLLLTGRFFATTLITLLLSVAFARLATKEIFGQYQYVLSVTALLSVFSLPGLNTAALRAFVEGDEQSIAQSVRYSLLASLVASAGLVGWGAWTYLHGHVILGLALAVAGILAPCYYAPNNWYIYYEGKLNFTGSTIRLIALNLVLLTGMVAGLKAGLNLIALVTLYFGINAGLNLWFYHEGKQQAKPHKGPSKLSLSYALRCTLQKFTVTLGENIQAIAVSALFGFASLAIYQVAQSFVNAFVGLTGALSATYFPLLVKYRRLNHGLIVVQHFVIGAAFWVIYLFAVKFLFAPLYGVKYHEAIELAHRLSWIVIILPLRVYLNNFFSIRDQNHYVIIVNFIASFCALGLFVATRNQGFFLAATLYLYSVNFLMAIPLLITYLMTAPQSEARASN